MKIHDIMKEQVLSISQMQELQELGIDISKASMCWIGCADGNDVYPYNSTFKDIFENHKETIPSVLTPTFTLQDILEIFPPYSLIKMINGNRRIAARCEGKHIEFIGKSELEVSFQMLKYCKQNNYL